MMKYKIILIALLLVSMTAFAKETNVPKAVKDSFAKLFPNASEIKWEQEKKNIFEVEFKDNGKVLTAEFNKKGKLMETETAIQASELPSNVEKVLAKKYPGYQITETAKIVDNKGKTIFEVEITKDKTKKDLHFDQNGKLLKSSEQEEGDEDHDKD